MIQPDDPNFIQPYTDGPKESNMKHRVIKCIPCGYTIISNLIAPKCGNCKRAMITVIYKNELAKRTNSTT